MNSVQLQKQTQTVLKQGSLTKQSRFLKNWRSRWFVLTPNYLLTFKDKKVYRSPTETIPLKKITSIKSDEEYESDRQYTFKITTADNVFYVSASCNAEREQWIGNISKVMVKVCGVVQ